MNLIKAHKKHNIYKEQKEGFVIKFFISLINFYLKMRVIVLVLLSLVLILDVKALAVASDYLEDNTLELIEETSTIYSIRLQNPNSYETKVKVDYNKNLMKAIDFKEEHTLPPESSTRIEFNVTAPKYNKKNNIFVMSYTVHQLTGPSGSGIGFLTKINKNFKVEVLRDPDKVYVDYIVVAAIALALFLYIFMKNITGYREKKKNIPKKAFKKEK